MLAAVSANCGNFAFTELDWVHASIRAGQGHGVTEINPCMRATEHSENNVKKLTLSDLANLAEIIGAVVIVISLIYVGRELKENTAAIQASSLQSITNASSTSMLAVVENGEFAEIRLQGDRDPSQLSDVERLRYILYQRQMWLHFQNVWTQWQLGVLSDEVWAGYEQVICGDLVETQARKNWWKDNHAYALAADFSRLIHDCD